MVGWNRGNIKLQKCLEAFFNEDNEGALHDARDKVKHLKRICNYAAEKLGFSSYKDYLDYLSQFRGASAIPRPTSSPKSLIKELKKELWDFISGNRLQTSDKVLIGALVTTGILSMSKSLLGTFAMVGTSIILLDLWQTTESKKPITRK